MDDFPDVPDLPNEGGSIDAEGAAEEAQSARWKWISMAFAAAGVLVAPLGMDYNEIFFGYALPLALVIGLTDAAWNFFRRKNRFLRFLRWWSMKIDRTGGGYYGFMTVATFVYLELQNLYQRWNSDGEFFGFFGIRDWNDFGMFAAGSAMDLAYAAMWPWRLWTSYGLFAAVPALLGWGVYRGLSAAVRRFLPLEMQASSPPISVEGRTEKTIEEDAVEAVVESPPKALKGS